MTAEEWEQRLAQAADLRRLELDCVVCAGCGAWPSYRAGVFVACKACDGTGRGKPIITFLEEP